MSCQIRSEEHTDHLLAYVAGQLRGEAAAKLELHMLACEDCAAFGKQQASVWNLLDAWEPRPVSADFDRRLYAKIEAAESASWMDRMAAQINEFLQPFFARPALPLAAASLIIAAGFVLDHPGKLLNSTTNQASLHVSSIEINKVVVDQVETTLDDMEMLRQFDPKTDEGSKESHSKSM